MATRLPRISKEEIEQFTQFPILPGATLPQGLVDVISNQTVYHCKAIFTPNKPKATYSAEYRCPNCGKEMKLQGSKNLICNIFCVDGELKEYERIIRYSGGTLDHKSIIPTRDKKISYSTYNSKGAFVVSADGNLTGIIVRCNRLLCQDCAQKYAFKQAEETLRNLTKDDISNLKLIPQYFGAPIPHSENSEHTPSVIAQALQCLKRHLKFRKRMKV